MMEDEGRFIAWTTGPSAAAFCICKPHDGEEASVGNGGMTAFACKTPAQVDKMYAKAIDLGATDEGSAGPRGEGGFYAGYFRDVDGNKCNFFSMS